MEEKNVLKEESLKSYPVLEDVEKEFEALNERNFAISLPEENRIVTLGIGESVSREELFNIRSGIYDICKRYGFENARASRENFQCTNMDKEIGEFIYKTMEITPSVAATLPMWQFLNICLIPDIIKWRWGDSKDHFISARRNYLGTQWWRFHLFSVTKHSIKKYMDMSDRDIADLYERTNSRGLPEHVANISLWFDELDKENVSGNSQKLYREVLKQYNAKLAFRLYFALSTAERFDLFATCYEKCKRD